MTKMKYPDYPRDENGWISVKDGLPHHHDWVLIAGQHKVRPMDCFFITRANEIGMYIDSPYYEKDMYTFGCTHQPRADIQAEDWYWQPLPEPPTHNS